jgi:hypothetical protein
MQMLHDFNAFRIYRRPPPVTTGKMYARCQHHDRADDRACAYGG